MSTTTFRNRNFSALGWTIGLFMLGGCDAAERLPSGTPAVHNAAAPITRNPEDSRMWMTVGEHRFAITLDDNAASRDLAALLPLTLDMSEHNGNEKFASLPRDLSTDASRPGTIRNGDVMLYGADTLVVFYKTFNSSYAYTRLGRIQDSSGLADALGRGSVEVGFSQDE